MDIRVDAAELERITREWFDRLWNRLDTSVMEERMHEDCEVLGLGNTVVGRAGLRGVHETFTASFDQIHVEVIDIVSDGAKVAGHARFAARHRQSAREVDFLFSLYGEFEEGRFRRVRNVVDYVSLLGQVQLFDPNLMTRLFEVPDSSSEST